MTELVTLEQVEALAVQLAPQEQLKLLAYLSERLSALNSWMRETGNATARHERAAAILALCDAAAERFTGESDAAEDIRRMRDERIEQLCRSGA